MNLAALPTLYSVFNYRTGLYDYFQPSGPVDLPASGTMRTPRGRTPESLAVRLPEDAVKVGDGELPRGVIATLSDDPASLGEVSKPHFTAWVSMAAAVGSLYLMWRMERRRSRKGRR